jgi:stage III sporulation protein AB
VEEENMIKIIGCILIIAASSMVGFTLAEELKKRALQLRDMQSAVIQLQNEIMFTHTALPQAFLKISRKCRNPIAILLESIGNKLSNNEVDTVYEAFINSLESLKTDIRFKTEDTEVILELAKGLGEADLEGHKKIFKLTDENLRIKIEEADRHISKSAKLYRYLGFSFGAVVAILLV